MEATTQLPREVRPTNYDVEVVPHADRMTFDGKVRINVDVLAPTRSITLNAVDMTFGNVSLGRAQGKSLVPKTSVDANAQTATFTFDQPLPVGSYLLSIDYSGKIGTQANGLFALDYPTEAGKKRALYTQFAGFITPDAFFWTTSGEALLMVIIGGTGTLGGAVLGSAAFILLQSLVSTYTERWMLILGVTFVLFVLFAPGGIVGALRGRIGTRA